MKNRITTYLDSLGKKKLLVPYFTAGFPTMGMTLQYIKAAECAGCDFVEIGIPFSDPLADGPEIQYASKVALDNKTTLNQIFELTQKVRKHSEIPLLFMGYYNPFLAVGVKKFLQKTADSKVDGLIIPDLPIDESTEIRNLADKQNISMTYLVAPTTEKKRIQTINNLTTGFVYAVTVTGVTGSGKKFSPETDKYLKMLQKSLNHRFVAGFGVSSPADAKRLAKYSDGVVIGSKLIKIIREAKTQKSSVTDIEKFLTGVRKSLS
ncbi:MAG: tryptophan synthase subunit alpha [Calditrichaeota bacterium]|nr:MAG: tryptophan synthase subunit alpha [Calditrichota bacterium]